MDWNKTKTIFIVVFSILNIFLYSLYLKQHTETQNVQTIGKTSIEELMKQENITYNLPQAVKNDFSYISANIKMFSKEELESLVSQSIIIVDNTQIESTMNKPISIQNSKGDYHFIDFLTKYVWNGTEYELWEVDKKNQSAMFFQQVDGEPIFYSTNAMLIIHWNEEHEVTKYEQRMLKDFTSFNKKKDLMTQDEAVSSLVTRGYVKQDSKILRVIPGYSTRVQLTTETQVFAPTWNIRVELKDGSIEEHFINAIEGKVIDFQFEKMEEDNPDEELDDDEVDE
ncbi:two-component system regulatory protein YycI [Sporosarcina oncorhynchi]|uniref:Two-component system regulatory protein YycI n=1 Tax=Sporosarcina oncorhynchi TaxID=3056444 RepID=A0ABZ0L4Q3_9BACL|nr:two-component system regulatory protein YycI [Sporosarcina sp. T2O-4]WOV87541.1 two-component system regulatory protein YycI [Sporosarcina sp. T2O-4]